MVTAGGGGKKNKYVRTLKSRKVLLVMMAIVERGPRVRDNQPFELNFDTRPIFIGQETSNVARLQLSPQTEKNPGNASR